MATPNLVLPTSPSGPSNISVAYNAAMQILDMLVVLVAQDKDLSAPPTTLDVDKGKRWIVGPAATGAWATHENAIAMCTGADLWTFFTPSAQWRGWILDESKYYRFNGSAWVDDSAVGALADAPSDGTEYLRKDAAWVNPVAAGTSYDNTVSALTAIDVQAAIDEVLGLIPGAPAAPTQSLVAACSDEATALTAGTAKVTFRNPYASAFTVTAVKASLTVAQTSGTIFTVDINEAGVSILSTKLTIDNTERTSSTAAAPPVLSDTSIAADAEITVDIDQVGDGTAKGLKVYIIGHL